MGPNVAELKHLIRSEVVNGTGVRAKRPVCPVTAKIVISRDQYSSCDAGIGHESMRALH